MSGSRQNVFPPGPYEGDAVIHGDNGLVRTLGRRTHKRAIRGYIRRIVADPTQTASLPSTMGLVVANANTTALPLTILTGEAEQFILTLIASGNPNDSGFLLIRFAIGPNLEAVSDWLTPVPFHIYSVNAAGNVGVSSYNGGGPVIYDLSFDAVQFALLPGSAGGSVQVDGMWTTNGARVEAAGTGQAA